MLACAFACCPPGTPGFCSGEDLLGWNLLKQIAKYHHVWALTYAPNRASIEEVADKEGITNIQFCYVDLPRWLRWMLRVQGCHQIYYHLWQLRAFISAVRLHRQHRFHIFHHVTYANDWLASFVGALLPLPYIRGPGGGAHRTPKGLQGEYPVSGRIWELVRRVGQNVLRHDPVYVIGHRRASAILVCNLESMRQLPRSWASKAEIFPVSGISSTDFKIDQQEQVDRRDHFRLLSAGTLIKIKGFGLAIKAFASFHETHPDSSLTIIGNGPEGPSLHQLVEQLGLEQAVHFRDWMPRNELLSEMARCDVFLFPSLRDGGGTVVVEAMAMGRPVICLDNGGPGMHITEEFGIKVVPMSREETIDRLRLALERLHQDENLRIQLGRAARKRALEVYEWDALGERLAGIYENALVTATRN